MKKFFKIFLLALILIPCGVVFVACGNSNPFNAAPTNQLKSSAEIDTAGSYKSSSITELNELENEESTTLNKFKLSGYTELISSGEKLVVNFNFIVDKSNPSNYKSALYCSVKNNDKIVTASYFVVDGYVYSDEDGIKTKEKATDDNEYNIPDTFVGFSSFDELINIIQSETSNLIIKKSVKDNQTKFEISQASSSAIEMAGLNSSVKNFESYIVFENNKLVGFTNSFEASLISPSQDITFFINSTLCSFNEEIEFPSLTDYQ